MWPVIIEAVIRQFSQTRAECVLGILLLYARDKSRNVVTPVDVVTIMRVLRVIDEIAAHLLTSDADDGTVNGVCGDGAECIARMGDECGECFPLVAFELLGRNGDILDAILLVSQIPTLDARIAITTVEQESTVVALLTLQTVNAASTLFAVRHLVTLLTAFSKQSVDTVLTVENVRTVVAVPAESTSDEKVTILVFKSDVRVLAILRTLHVKMKLRNSYEERREL
jgi:hypothetical protein